MKNKIIVITFLIFLFGISIVLNNFHKERIDKLIENKYLIASENIQNSIKRSIELKKQKGLTLALALAQNKHNIEFFEKKHDSVDLHTLSQSLRNYTNQKNVWIHLVSNEGISLYRSWAKKKGDNVAKIRKELPPLLKNPKPTNLISVGIFDLAFKSIVPVYKDEKFLGIVEVISKINSISDEFKKDGYNSLVIVDKKYKKQIKKPFTKNFVKDYYVANLNAQNTYLKLFEQNSRKLTVANENYTIFEKELAVTYQIKDIFGKDMAYFIVFDSLDKVSMKDIENIDNFIKILGVFLLLLIVIGLTAVYLYNRSKYTKKLEHKVAQRTKELLELKDYHTALFDKNPSIVFVAAINYGIIEANSSFFKRFTQFKTLDEFNKNNQCLCNFALVIDDETYINPKKDWKIQITQPHRKLCLKLEDKLYHFRLESEVLEHHVYDEVFLITLTDITELIDTQKELEQKQALIYQQSKNASMGEMIGNIAHQWRQPLSVISTAATGIKMKKQFSSLDDGELIETCDMINENAQYLSKTIDDFRNFIKGDREALRFNLKESIEKFLTLVDPVLKKEVITIVSTMDESIELYSYPSELQQCLINIFNNSKDALKESDLDQKYIFIETYKEANRVIIKFKDNGGGIDSKIISRVFEPYFTTKHQSQGTGLGLSMTFTLVTEGMKGSIFVHNKTYKYNNAEYKGAEFIIELPSQ